MYKAIRTLAEDVRAQHGLDEEKCYEGAIEHQRSTGTLELRTEAEIEHFKAYVSKRREEANESNDQIACYHRQYEAIQKTWQERELPKDLPDDLKRDI